MEDFMEGVVLSQCFEGQVEDFEWDRHAQEMAGGVSGVEDAKWGSDRAGVASRPRPQGPWILGGRGWFWFQN